MKSIIFLIAILASFTTQSQETKSLQKIFIGYNFSPDYNFRTLKKVNGISIDEIILQERNNNEVAKFGFTTGVNICIYLSQTIQLETGVQFSNKGYKTHKLDLYYIPENPSLPDKVKIIYSYQYIGIPLKARFSFEKNKVCFTSRIGFSANFLLGAKHSATYKYSDGKSEKKTETSNNDFRKLDISPEISIGIGYKLTNKIHLFAEPAFRYGILKTNKTTIKENLWNVGLNTGIYYVIKK